MSSHDPAATDTRESAVEPERQPEENQPEETQTPETVSPEATEEMESEAAASHEPAVVADDDADAVGGEEFVTAALEEARKDVLRAQAELENFRKRARREMEESRQYAELALITDLLPVLDNLNRALETAPGEGSAGLIQGVKMVADLLVQTLAKHDCHPIDAVGQPFDPNFHAAISQQPTEEHEPGTVVMEVQRGYRLHDRVVRPAQVIIASSPN